jgi:superoxide reductase
LAPTTRWPAAVETQSLTITLKQIISPVSPAIRASAKGCPMHNEERRICKCSLCDTVVEVLDPCGPELICCGRQMEDVTGHAGSPQREKHILLMDEHDGQTTLRVGINGHENSEKHYIAWIEVLADGKCLRQYITPPQEAKASFQIAAADISAGRCYCNIHGLWRFSAQTMRRTPELAPWAHAQP